MQVASKQKMDLLNSLIRQSVSLKLFSTVEFSIIISCLLRSMKLLMSQQF